MSTPARWFTAKTSEFDYARATRRRLERRLRGARRYRAGQKGRAGLGRRVVRDSRDVVEAVRLPQGEQVLGFGGEGVHPRRGPCLAAVDAVVVAAGADLRPLRGVGGPHGRGQRGVEVLGQAAYLRVGGAPGLRLPELRLRLAGGVEKLP